MKEFPYPDNCYNLTEAERNQAMLLYHTFQLYKLLANLQKIGANPAIDKNLIDYRRKKIEQYQKKVLTNR